MDQVSRQTYKDAIEAVSQQVRKFLESRIEEDGDEPHRNLNLDEHQEVATSFATASLNLTQVAGWDCEGGLARQALRNIREELEEEITRSSRNYFRDFPTSPPIYHYYELEWDDEKDELSITDVMLTCTSVTTH